MCSDVLVERSAVSALKPRCRMSRGRSPAFNLFSFLGAHLNSKTKKAFFFLSLSGLGRRHVKKWGYERFRLLCAWILTSEMQVRYTRSEFVIFGLKRETTQNRLRDDYLFPPTFTRPIFPISILMGAHSLFSCLFYFPAPYSI